MTEISRRQFGIAAAATSLNAATPVRYQVGAYYFPNFHVDPRNELAHGPGWTEWELVKRGAPRFPGHAQPKRPLWGYQDESDPRVMERKIAAAADHGLTHFLFDWYWYDGVPFLNRALERGFLKAANSHRMRFALMWANHNWLEIFPAKFRVKPPPLYPGAVSRDAFEKITDYVVREYFTQPSYWRLDGCPYFSIYELYRLVEGLGGLEPAREALASFRAKTRAAGFRDLHLNAVVWGIKILPGERAMTNPNQILAGLHFDSVTSYVWIHHVPLRKFPVTDYGEVAAEAARYWQTAASTFQLPYHPNVTMGWDSSPRTCQSDVFANTGYPFTPVLGGNTPERFKASLRAVKQFLDSRGQRVFNINAWNEWTEGSYLEPDMVNGLRYLEAVKEVFG
jgi:hypothetical protein